MERITRLTIIPTRHKQNLFGVLILLTMILSQAATIDPSSNYEYIDIVYLQKKPIVKGMLNGKEAFFLLDTGSDLTLLHEKAGRHYGFKSIYRNQDTRVVQGIGSGGTQMMFAYDVDLLLGSQKIKARYRAYDIANIVESIQSHSRIRIAGIIGSDVMRNYGFKIDYKKKLVGIDVLPTKTKRKHARN